MLSRTGTLSSLFDFSVLRSLLCLIGAFLLTVTAFSAANYLLDLEIERRLELGLRVANATPNDRYQHFLFLHGLAPDVFKSQKQVEDIVAAPHAHFLAEGLRLSQRPGRDGWYLGLAELAAFLEHLHLKACRQGGGLQCARYEEAPPDLQTGSVDEGQTPAGPWAYLARLKLARPEHWNEPLLEHLKGYCRQEARSSSRCQELRDERWSLPGLYLPLPPEQPDEFLYHVDRSTTGSVHINFQEMESALRGALSHLKAAAPLSRRAAVMLNGNIQWITSLLAFWCALLLLDRWRFSRWSLMWIASQSRKPRVPKGTLLKDFAGEWQALVAGGLDIEAARRRILKRYERTLERSGYVVIDWLIFVVPMLGFIGTIVGMTLAMGNASDVVAVQDPADLEQAMSKLSGYLGTAFDTTLVALVSSMLLEANRRLVARTELRVLERLRVLPFANIPKKA